MAVYLISGVTGLFGGVFLFMGLVALLAGPDAVSQVTNVDLFEQFPAEVQALLLREGIWLCASVVGLPCGIAFLGFLLSRSGRPAREYLGLKWPTLGQALGWGALIQAVELAFLFSAKGFGLPVTGDGDYAELAGFPLFIPLLVLTLVVLTPLFEELIFRGFLLEGLRHTRLGETGAIVVTALWMVGHSGSDGRLLLILLSGMLLAVARLRTGSTYLTVLIHALTNLVAVVAMIASA